MAASTSREITVGDWTWGPEEEQVGAEPALSHHGVEFWAGGVTAAGLRQAATDLMRLADAVAAYHAEQNQSAPFTEEDMYDPDSPFHARALDAWKAMRAKEAADHEQNPPTP
jgi:hypothetical protein